VWTFSTPSVREPVDDEVDYGAHGAFDDRARGRSYQLWGVTHPKQAAALVVGLLAVVKAVRSRWR